MEVNAYTIANKCNEAYYKISPALVQEVLKALEAAGYKVVRR